MFKDWGKKKRSNKQPNMLLKIYWISEIRYL